MAPGDGSRSTGAPTISDDGLSATYEEVWPGVDVRFVVTNASVRKEIVLTRPGTSAAFDMTIDGVALSQGPDGRITTAKDSEFTVGQVAVFDKPRCPDRCRVEAVPAFDDDGCVLEHGTGRGGSGVAR